jgi:hypothetical protein
MNDLERHTYRLEPYHGKASRHICPQCGDKTSFVYYIDENGNILDKSVGRCNHESGCGYHYTPKDYFSDNRIFRPEQRPSSNKVIRYEQPAQISYLDKSIVYKSQSTKNNLVLYLCSYFDIDTIFKAAALYFMGSTRDGSAIFYQIDTDMKVRSGKIISYQENGHRNKESGVNWVHSKLNLPDFNLKQCLFGLHLVNLFKDKPIAIVESEKSALICSMIDDRFLWMAVGGKSQLSEERLQPIKDKRIILHPDNDGFDLWQKKADELNRVGFNVKVSPFVTNHAIEPTDDICDILMRVKEPISAPVVDDVPKGNKVIEPQQSEQETTLNRMIGKNPNLQILIDKFNLIAV